MDRKAHWEHVYETRASSAVSWYQRSPTRSLELLDSTGMRPTWSIADIGGGDSTLVDALVERGVEHVTVVDISRAALDRARARLGRHAEHVQWIEGDITTLDLGDRAFDVWHDRAVFHFLTAAADRERYIRTAHRAVRPGGAIVIATFALDGPERCSGLPVVRYDGASLASAFAPHFDLETALGDEHHTPSGSAQRFTYAVLRRR